jgi:hypothetical protein
VYKLLSSNRILNSSSTAMISSLQWAAMTGGAMLNSLAAGHIFSTVDVASCQERCREAKQYAFGTADA